LFTASENTSMSIFFIIYSKPEMRLPAASHGGFKPRRTRPKTIRKL